MKNENVYCDEASSQKRKRKIVKLQLEINTAHAYIGDVKISR
jgi:hypothetical protein